MTRFLVTHPSNRNSPGNVGAEVGEEDPATGEAVGETEPPCMAGVGNGVGPWEFVQMDFFVWPTSFMV